jgi:penicillin-binding protein 2
MLVVDQLRRGDQRLRVLAIGIFAGLLLLLAGLWYVQVVHAGYYQARMRNQTFRTVREPAVRGRILDREGRVLAENRPGYILNLYIEELRPLFRAEYWRQRAAYVAGKAMTSGPASPPSGFRERLLAGLRPATRRVRLTRDEIMALNHATRFTVVSNTVARVGALLGTPLALTEQEYRRHHYQWPYRPLPILENLTPAQVARFLEQAPVLPGVDLEVRPVRHYPHGQRVAHVLGYLTRDDQARGEEEEGFNYSLPSYEGAIGIEFGYNETLLGRPGIRNIVVDSLSYREEESVWVASEAGQNVVLTLDLDLQLAAWRALQSAGPNVRGAVVVLDVTNGDVLALVSSPAYDPNDFLDGITEEDWRERLNHPQLRPMLNRATQGAYPPGSIFKMVTALACLDAGLDPAALFTVPPDPANPGRGAIFVGRRKIRDTAPPGDYDFRRALLRSSNAYFIHHGLAAGRDRLLEMGKRLFLGERIGLPLRQEVRGFFPYPREVRWQWVDGNVANACIGQEITVTPLQMAVLTAAVANGGSVFWPRLVLRVEPPEPGPGATATSFPPRLRGELGVPPAHLQILREAMLADTVEPEGTGFAAFHERDRRTPALKHMRVGGKTGTAEIEENGRTVDYITWFTAFGPYDRPQYAVVAMVESGRSGGGTCAPVVRQIFQHLERRETDLPPALAWGGE